ncbi:MAG: ABC transporter substrate-binding protein [Clostridiales bacterium]|nr:ABC transporter substrate-binding protein [Clostridiales bacterium]MDY2836162.1 ABC transporter substrate-binding protein [Candidatus Aphodomonas sp.]
MSKKLAALFLAVLMAFSMTSAFAENASVTVTDMYGREITLSEPATRIVALTPSDCEILCALGCEDALVGRGKYCDYPASIQELPVVQSGAETNIEEILALNPQVVLMSDMSQTEEQANMLEENGVKVVISDANDIAGVYTAIRMIGTLMGKDAEAETLIADMQATFDEIAAKSEKSGKTVYFEVSPLQWGLWTAGSNTFMDELATLCGASNAFSDIEGWQAISEEQVIDRNPDYIVSIAGMGDTGVEEILSREGWSDVTAVKNGDVYSADSNAISRPGPRLKDAAIELYNFLNGVDAAEAPAA